MNARSVLKHLVPRPLSASLKPDQNSFGVIRLALAFAVLVSHAFFLKHATVDAEPLLTWTGYTLGQHAVQGFFILSGILVAQSLMRSGSVKDFARARALRIFPGLIVCVLVTALIAGPLVSTLTVDDYFRSKVLATYLAKTVLLITGSAPLPGVFEAHVASGAVNTSLWTLKYEVLCYVGLAILAALAMRTRRQTMVLYGAAAVWVAAMLVDRPSLVVGAGLLDTIQYFALFFGAGVAAYALRQYLYLSALVMLPLIAVAWSARQTAVSEVAYAALLTYGICWIGSLSFGRATTFTRDQDYSFGLYIYAMPVSQLILHFHPAIDVLGLIVTTTCLTLPLACLSWNLIEHPAIAWSKRLRGSTIAVQPTETVLNADPTHAQTAPVATEIRKDVPAAAGRRATLISASVSAPFVTEVEAAKTRLYAALAGARPPSLNRARNAAKTPINVTPRLSGKLPTKPWAPLPVKMTKRPQSGPSAMTPSGPSVSVGPTVSASRIMLATRAQQTQPA
jgi:peptidoglycan/LPS O-acetylase OafA/YrhL